MCRKVLPLLPRDMLEMTGLLCLSSNRLTEGDRDDDRCQQTTPHPLTQTNSWQTWSNIPPSKTGCARFCTPKEAFIPRHLSQNTAFLKTFFFLMKTENMSPVGFNSTLCKLKLCEKESSIVSFWNQYTAQIGFWFWFYNPLSLTVHTDRHLYARILCFFFLFFGLRSGGRASNLTKSPLRVDRFSDPWPWNLLTSHYPFITKTKQPRLDRMHRRSLRG